jgi:hypothetical protein
MPRRIGRVALEKQRFDRSAGKTKLAEIWKKRKHGRRRNGGANWGSESAIAADQGRIGVVDIDR